MQDSTFISFTRTRYNISHLDKRSSLVHYHRYAFDLVISQHSCMLHPGYVIYCVYASDRPDVSARA